MSYPCQIYVLWYVLDYIHEPYPGKISIWSLESRNYVNCTYLTTGSKLNQGSRWFFWAGWHVCLSFFLGAPAPKLRTPKFLTHCKLQINFTDWTPGKFRLIFLIPLYFTFLNLTFLIKNVCNYEVKENNSVYLLPKRSTLKTLCAKQII